MTENVFLYLYCTCVSCKQYNIKVDCCVLYICKMREREHVFALQTKGCTVELRLI